MLKLEHIKSIFKFAPSANIIINNDSPNYTIAWVNPCFLEMVGAKPAELLGKRIFDVFTGISEESDIDDNNALRTALSQCINLKVTQKAGVQRYINPARIPQEDEPVRLWHCRSYPLLDDQEPTLFVVLTLEAGMEKQTTTGDYPLDLNAKNIRAAERSKQELKEQRMQFDAYQTKMSNILESITDGFWAVDRDWTVTYWNKEAERILQRPREAMIGTKLWDAYPLDTHPAFYEVYQKAMSDNISAHMEIHYVLMDTWMEIAVFPSEEGLSVYFKDITPRKRIEANLTEAKKQYQELFDLSPLPQWVYDAEDYSFKDVNQAAITHYGYSKAEFLSMTIRDIRPREDIAGLEAFISETVKQGYFHKVTVRHVKKTGEIIDVQVEGNSILFEGKTARLVLAVDITEKSRAQQALRASEQKFKALVQDGSDLLAIFDNTGNFTYVNHTTSRILEFSPEALIGKNVFDFVHEEDKERVIREFESLTSRETFKIAPYRFKNGIGQYPWIETIITNMTDDPAVAGVVSNSRDVTQRIADETKIQESINRYNIVSKATSDAIWDLDPSTGLIEWNEAAVYLFGSKSTQTTIFWWEGHIHPYDAQRVMNTLESRIANKESRNEMEYRFRCANGCYKTVLDRSFLLFNEQGELVRMIGSMQDITERVKYVQTVEEQNQRLKEIAWTQSHVVRTPLARIMGIADLLTQGDTEQAIKEELLSHLTKSAAELDTIIREISRKTEVIYNGSDSLKR